ncbi:MAG: DNA/RNA non-specific endonuclease [Bacteroidales bacterium]|nr:DNA/RNA non-specific endonuclease [Bacteroidales bacterium]
MTRYYRSPSRKKKKKTLPYLTILILLLVIVSIKAIDQCSAANEGPLPVTNNAEELMAVKTNPLLEEQLVRYKGMDVSFNPYLHIPNWVAWELTAEEAQGTEPRSNQFACDPNVESCPQSKDYSYSGYDRGHMAPAGDMKWSQDAMKETFYMTNICPQEHTLNTGAWKSLEEKCRVWAQADSAIIIIAGPVLANQDDVKERIGSIGVGVPKSFFKVILSPYANPPRAIAFIMENGRVEGGIQQAVTTVDNVEALTGHDFFSALPDSIEDVIESHSSWNQWTHMRARSNQRASKSAKSSTTYGY